MKKTLRKIICTVLIVAVLSLSIGTRYFDSNHIEKVEAGTLVIAGGISVATLAEICLFVGTTALAAYGIYEGYENRKEIARFGKEFIDSCGNTVDGWVAQIVDTSGQDYVFGSEALELIQDTEWSVLQGGLPPEGDPNKKDDKDKDKLHIPGDPMTHVAQFTALGATWFTTNAKNIYQDWCDILDGWVGKDTPMPENNPLANNFPNSFTGFEKNAEGLYTVSGYYHVNYKNGAYVYDRIYSNFQPIAEKAVLYQNGSIYDVIHKVNNVAGYESCYLTCTLKSKDTYYGGDYQTSIYKQPYFGYYGTLNSWSFSINLPIYATQAEAIAALHDDDFTDALNYGKDYRIADWLKQEWVGQLIDPLVNIGLSLSQLIEIMKQLGIKTMQGLTAEQLLDLLKKSLPKINSDLLPDATPSPTVVDPALDPIYYPDPDAHPDKPPRPVIDPNSGKNPSPTPNPEPDPMPIPNPIPELDIPIDDVVPTVESSFGDIAGSIRYKFPFSIPWDIRYLFVKLSSTPKVPRFELPIKIERRGIDEKIIVDLKDFQKVSDLSRSMLSMLFLIQLIKLTMLVVGMRKEE